MDTYRIKQLKPTFTLTSERDHKVAERIGKGRFTTAYRVINSDTVYLVVNEDAGDYSKDILAMCDGPHFPELEKVGYIGDKPVWKTQFYRRLTAAHRQPWKHYKMLKECMELASNELRKQRGFHEHLSNYAYLVNERAIELFRERYPQEEILLEALESLQDAMHNYGSSYLFEFAPRNLGVYDMGVNGSVLIMLDPCFDVETIERDQAIRMKKARGY